MIPVLSKVVVVVVVVLFVHLWRGPQRQLGLRRVGGWGWLTESLHPGGPNFE